MIEILTTDSETAQDLELAKARLLELETSKTKEISHDEFMRLTRLNDETEIPSSNCNGSN